MSEQHPIWYLLYEGTSPDGMGDPYYCGRTTKRDEAIKHFRKCKADPYSTGKVIRLTDKQETELWSESDA